jgi:cupin 2 domain-containing protein
MPEKRQKEMLKNIFAGLAESPADELMETLLQGGGFRLERIVSRGHASPENFWYDQEHSEWVMLLSGSARLLFADSGEEIELHPGNYLIIPAHRKHRVAWTDPDQPSVWLAIHYE